MRNEECGARALVSETPAQFENLRKRTKAVGLRVIKVVEALPRNRTCDIIGRQMLRSGVSIGANYRAACRARSTKEFIAKMGIVEEETDETLYWLEVLIAAGEMKEAPMKPLMNEISEILAITVSSINTARKGKRCE